MIEPSSDERNASDGESKIAIVGVTIKFNDKRLDAPINTLIGMQLKATYSAAKIAILAAFKELAFNFYLSSQQILVDLSHFKDCFGCFIR